MTATKARRTTKKAAKTTKSTAAKTVDPDMVTALPSELTPVGVTPSAMSSLAIRFTPEVLEQLRSRSEAEGIGVTQLVRTWVLERLQQEKLHTMNPEVAEALQVVMMHIDPPAGPEHVIDPVVRSWQDRPVERYEAALKAGKPKPPRSRAAAGSREAPRG